MAWSLTDYREGRDGISSFRREYPRTYRPMCNIGHAQIILIIIKWQFICLAYIFNLINSNERLVIAEVILPLAIGQAYSFSVPPSLENLISVGQRVQVQFGKKRMYAGIVYNLTDSVAHDSLKFKEVLAILDEKPILTKRHMDFWKWIADYYACHLGEVMISALPSGLNVCTSKSTVCCLRNRYPKILLTFFSKN